VVVDDYLAKRYAAVPDSTAAKSGRWQGQVSAASRIHPVRATDVFPAAAGDLFPVNSFIAIK